MNGGGSSTGGLSGSLVPFERDEQPRERAGEAAAELWLAMSQRAQRVETLPLGQIETPNAWRPGAGDLTPNPGVAVGSGAEAPDSSSVERMTLLVDGGELGELQVTLDRHDGALSVVIGLENSRFVSSVLPDARALRLALEGAGLNVHALSVVTTSEVGTVLAQRRMSLSGHKPTAEQTSSEEQPEQANKRAYKRLTLIG